MPKLTKDIKQWAAGYLPGAAKALACEALAGDGSDRRYFRLRAGQAAYVALWGPRPAENLAYLTIGRHLFFNGLPVPRFYGHDLTKGFFILEDLGDRHIFALPPQRRLDAYYETVEILGRLHHQKVLAGFEKGWAWQTPVYDARLVYEREIGYFLNSFVFGHLKMPKPKTMPTVLKEARRLASLAALQDGLVVMHRDFQCRNIMIKNDKPYIIDWQGARLGPGGYDLASLTHDDPFMILSDGDRWQLAEFYIKENKLNKSFLKRYNYLAAARLMQALGAYGHLFNNCGKTKFAAFMPQTLKRLSAVVAGGDFSPYPGLRSIITESHARMEAEK